MGTFVEWRGGWWECAVKISACGLMVVEVFLGEEERGVEVIAPGPTD
jgi:hypothetical protein